MGKAIYDDVHCAAEFAERTESNAFDMVLGALRMRVLPPPTNRLSAPLALALYSAVILATRRFAALRKGPRRRTLRRSFGPVGIPVVRLKLRTDWARLISNI